MGRKFSLLVLFPNFSSLKCIFLGVVFSHVPHLHSYVLLKIWDTDTFRGNLSLSPECRSQGKTEAGSETSEEPGTKAAVHLQGELSWSLAHSGKPALDSCTSTPFPSETAHSGENLGTLLQRGGALAGGLFQKTQDGDGTFSAFSALGTSATGAVFPVCPALVWNLVGLSSQGANVERGPFSYLRRFGRRGAPGPWGGKNGARRSLPWEASSEVRPAPASPFEAPPPLA